ncbi:MAG: LPS-assembly protein LptD, partial [Muribaculaceae bacterium]|nr:LPS-assembly protein LptD [Muribaculaceae bacterium]
MKSCGAAVGCVQRRIESELRQLIIYILCAVLIGIAYSQNAGHVPRLQEPEASDTVVTAVPEEARVAADAGALRGEDDFSFADEPDSITVDTARTAISRIDRSKVDIETAVSFSAKDSLVLEGLNNAYLYGDGTVEYQDFKLNSAEIRMELDSSTVYAAGVVDTAGVAQGRPVFKDKSGEYESETMKYNFKTDRGYITGVITEQDEGFLQGGRAKRMDDGSFYVEDGKYTTCDDHDHPHFYFQLTRAKVRPDKDVVTGPAYMVLADVPLPLALPFGYFPFSKKYSSGVIFPSFGDDYNLGFYLRDGGYYFAINDNVDLALTGEIYT